LKDLTGRRYGKLIALHPDGQDSRKRFYWLCICDCGNEVKVKSNNLRTGNSKSCGCVKKELGKSVKDLTGKVFGELTVLERDMSRTDGGKVYWLCKCSCGEVVSVWRAHLLNKHSVKCAIRGRHTTSNSAKMAFWSETVKRRDDYICQKCGFVGDDNTIHAHHILSFTKYPELREDLANGSCLCVPCHKQFHNEYGVMRNNKDDFVAWLNKAEESAK
jgi:5-methylcytosine-specific restriction endonuclease McrA